MPDTSDVSPQAIFGVAPVFSFLAITSTGLRLYTRGFIAHNLGYDDALIAVATVFASGSTAMVILEAVYDYERRRGGISERQQMTYVQSVYASIILYNIAICAVKFSILTQYLRIFPSYHFRRICFASMSMVFVYSCWCIWSSVFFCIPVQGFWDFSIKSRCLNKEAVWYANASVTCLPLPLLRHLKIPKRSKIALMAVFALGGFTCIVSILRLESIYSASHLVGSLNAHGAMAALWSAVEMNTGIVCSCLPTLRTLVTKALPKLLNSSIPTASADRPNPTGYHHNRSSKAARHFGYALGSQDPSTQYAFARKTDNADFELELHEMAATSKDIKVVTVVNQEVEEARDDSNRSDHESMKDLIRGSRI